MSTGLVDVVSDGAESDDALRQCRSALNCEIIVKDVWDMVDQVTQLLGKNKMRRLRIFGHGAPGVAFVGNVGVTRSFDTRESIAKQWLNSPKTLQVVKHVASNGSSYLLLNDSYLLKLRGCFTSDGWAELHHCYVAQGEFGQALMKALATIWAVPVKGGAGKQFIGGGVDGVTIVAYPGGQIRKV